MSTKKPRITIKPFKHQVQLDPSYSKNTWSLIEGAIIQVFKRDASKLSFEELYRNAYNMVLHKYGLDLYEGLRKLVTTHLDEISTNISKSNDDSFLVTIKNEWEAHKTSMLMIRDILMYLDRQFCTREKLAPVYDLGLQIWRDRVARSSKIQSRLQSTVLELIGQERVGEVIDVESVKSVLKMLMDCGIGSRFVYEKDFETAFLSSSTNFYRIESNQVISENSCPEYLRKVEARIDEELDRVGRMLDTDSEPKIRVVVEAELISAHMKALIESSSGVVPMLRDDKTDDLARMYRLFSRVDNGLDLLREVSATYVRETGLVLINDPDRVKEPLLYVQALLDMKDKYDNIMASSFASDKLFQQSLNTSFEHFINKNQRTPEYISLFVDDKLKKGLKGVSEDEAEIILDKVMKLFRHISEKDVFEKYYKQHLAKRLLLNRSVSDDAERSMISKIKLECGFQFTSKLEGMFTDIKLSRDTMADYKEHLGRAGGPKSSSSVELDCKILTTGFWPGAAPPPCTLPSDVMSVADSFKNFYLSRHTGRRLAWQTNLGTADITGFFKGGKKELNVSTYCMVVLSHFSDPSLPPQTYKDLFTATNIPPRDLKRALQSLACAKYKVLTKEPKGKDISEEDTFTFNDAFTAKLRRIKIGVVSASKGDTEPERKETRAKVDEDRKHQIEAAIVRTMKSRKTLEHNNLITEVVKQLSSRFTPNPTIIKKRIESLIEREYLERSKKDRRTYNYLA